MGPHFGYPPLRMAPASYRGRQIAAILGWFLSVGAFIGVVNGVRASRIDVRNDGDAAVTDLVLRYQDGELFIGDLAPGQRASLRLCPDRGGVAEVSWRVRGEERKGRAGYLECGVFCLELDLQSGGAAIGQSTSCH